MSASILSPAQLVELRRWVTRNSVSPEERAGLLATAIQDLCTVLDLSITSPSEPWEGEVSISAKEGGIRRAVITRPFWPKESDTE